MADLFSFSGTLEASYSAVYETLCELREAFHRYGRLDDSNAKIDEVAKLFAMYLAFKVGQISSFPDPSDQDLIPSLQAAFHEVAVLPRYRSLDGISIFGKTPTLALRAGDERLAVELTSLVRSSIDLAYELRSGCEPFDILNEAFGHFVRDNFRGNIEDAQYMTPPEVVDFMARVAMHDMQSDPISNDANGRQWTVLDPTCGVGSFLAAIYTLARESNWLDPNRLRLFGQDKVERMVRLATLNLELFEVAEHRITLGNSLALGSSLDKLNGQVDLILTNPPFGARFDLNEVSRTFGDNTPFFSRLRQTSRSVDSELLFVDRNLRLLRDGGRLLIVVPDSVISARGLAAMLRQEVSSRAVVRAIIELPSVTFAQAGTRTKTAVLYLQKFVQRKTEGRRVFIAISKDLGFLVKSRKGVQIKISTGENDLPQLFAVYKKPMNYSPDHSGPIIVSENPSGAMLPAEELAEGSWTPSHYSATRLNSLVELERGNGFDLIALRNVVDFVSDLRRPEIFNGSWVYISVLHVLGEGLLDIQAALDYAPKTPGIEAKPGEILLSRINPRIPRICVVPNLNTKILCSPEFEIMRPAGDHDIYALAFLLQSRLVQDQISSLTSGTSASHNRIRTSELAEVQIPIPRSGSREAQILNAIAGRYGIALETIMTNAQTIAGLRGEEKDLFRA